MADWLNRTRLMFNGVSYYHGRLSPEQANFRLNRRGCIDGLYLIYEDVETSGKFILAICSENRIRIYYLGFSEDGCIKYGDGVSVPLMHPHELIHYHLQKSSAFPVRPLTPCLRPLANSGEPVAWQSVTMNELETRMLYTAQSDDCISNPSDVLKSKRKELLLSAAKELHTFQSWFHGPVDRDEAERRLSKDGVGPSGKFLIREKDGGNYALSMCYKNAFRHYTVSRMKTDDGDLFALDDEPAFPNIMDIVEHYSNKPNSFVLALTAPCARSDFKKSELPQLNPEAAMALNNYTAETWPLQNSDDDGESGSRSNVVQTEQRIEVAKDDRRKLELQKSALKLQKTNELMASEKDDDDKTLEAMISSVLPLNNDDLLVERVDI